MAPWRFSASTLGLLGMLALTLAALGVYAVVSQSVVERRREIGVRVAVGALPHQIARLVLGEGLRLTVIGIAMGLVVAVATTRVLTSLLYDLEPYDPLTLASIAALFVAVSTLAILAPTWRASRVDSVVVLRE